MSMATAWQAQDALKKRHKGSAHQSCHVRTNDTTKLFQPKRCSRAPAQTHQPKRYKRQYFKHFPNQLLEACVLNLSSKEKKPMLKSQHCIHPSVFKHSPCSQSLRELLGHHVLIYGPSSTTTQQSEAMIQDFWSGLNWQPMMAMTVLTCQTFLQ